MANDSITQPNPQDLDVIQHPTLGKLSFPKTMGVSDRNALIDELENTRQQAAVPGAMQTKPGGKITQAPQEPSTLGEFGRGLLDPIKAIPQTAAPGGLLDTYPEQQIQDAEGYRSRAHDALKQGDIPSFIGHAVNAVLSPTMIPQMVESLSQMNPARASGNILSLAAMEKAPEAGAKAMELPGKIREMALGDADASALKGLHVSPRSTKTQATMRDVQGARPYLQGAESQADLQVKLPPAKSEVWKPYSDALTQVGSRPVNGPDGPSTVAELEKERLKTSARLTAARSMKPTDVQSVMQKDQVIKALSDRDTAIKAVIDPELASTGINPAKIRETFGSLKGVERKVSGKATIAETPQPSGLGRMKNVKPISKPSTLLTETGQGIRDIAAGRPLWSAKPTDLNIKEGFRVGGDKPDLGSVQPPQPHPPLQQNLLPPMGGTSGPRTSAGPGVGVNPANPRPSTPTSAVPSQIPLREGMTNPPLGPERQLPAMGGTSVKGKQLSSEVQAPQAKLRPTPALQLPASPPSATIAPYLTGKHEFSIIPAETPSSRALTIRQLREQGYKPQVIRGAESGQPGVSVFVPDMPTHEALQFVGHMDDMGVSKPTSIVTKQGLVDVGKGTTRPIAFHKTLFGSDAINKPSYSIASGGGEELPFALSPQDHEIPVKTPYEGEHHSETIPGGTKTLVGSRVSSPETVARHTLNPRDAVPRVTFADKGTVVPGVPSKHVHAFKGELSIATIEDNPVWKQGWLDGAKEAQEKGLQGKDINSFARTHAEKVLYDAGWDGYRSRNPKNQGFTVKFGDADVFKPGEEPEPTELTPHPNAPPTLVPQSTPTATKKPATVPKAKKTTK